jgi:hypothetical protein
MLNIFSNLETAAGARAGSGLGACPPGPVRTGTAKPNGTDVMALPRPRPRAVSPADVLGYGRAAAFQGTAVGHGQPFGLPNTCEKYVHTTRIAAASGGASGLQPRWDPV